MPWCCPNWAKPSVPRATWILTGPTGPLEIGSTWYGVEYQRTFVNTECKHLLLKHAFDDLGARRVCIKTDTNNARSRRAIERIGGVQEGILRNHRVNRDGSNRDSIYYSIIEEEWPQVRENLERMLDRE